MQADSLAVTRLVASGDLRGISPDAPPERPLTYDIWTSHVPGNEWPSVWVDLHVPDAPNPVRLTSTAVEILRRNTSSRAGPITITEAGVGVSDGELSMTVRQQWPLGASLAIVLGVLALGVAVSKVRRGRRLSATFQRIARHEVTSREAERTRLAREIHDGPLQDVAALARAAGTAPEAQETLQRIVSELRSLSAGLRPPSLDRFGIQAALDDLAERWASQLPPLTVRVQCDPVALSAEAELAAYRIAQEALSNAAHHGRAGKAWVFLRAAEHGTDLVVRDDGTGSADLTRITQSAFDQLVRDGHFGLAGMRERARSVSGSLHIGPGPGGHGTEVRLTLPASS